jgi:hypothetical protein
MKSNGMVALQCVTHRSNRATRGELGIDAERTTASFGELSSNFLTGHLKGSRNVRHHYGCAVRSAGSRQKAIDAHRGYQHLKQRSVIRLVDR